MIKWIDGIIIIGKTVKDLYSRPIWVGFIAQDTVAPKIVLQSIKLSVMGLGLPKVHFYQKSISYRIATVKEANFSKSIDKLALHFIVEIN